MEEHTPQARNEEIARDVVALFENWGIKPKPEKVKEWTDYIRSAGKNNA